MAIGIQLLAPKTLFQPQRFKLHPFTAATHFRKKRKTQISCTRERIGDADLASDLAKINAHLAQKEEAMRKSKELLFSELCQYLAMEKEEMKRKWSKMDQEEKWVLVKGFVNEWRDNFHPLSVRSVREMIEEYVNQEKPSASSSFLFPGLKRITGFSQNE